MLVPELRNFPPGVVPIVNAYVGDESLYVCDSYNDRVQVFRTNDCAFDRSIGTTTATSSYTLAEPNAIAFIVCYYV